MECARLAAATAPCVAVERERERGSRTRAQFAAARARGPSGARISMGPMQRPERARAAASTDETMPEQAERSRHPLDPHKPVFSNLLPEFARPYPSFEGWYTRLWDPESNFSAGMIMATNYATQESQVTLVFTPAPRDVGPDASPAFELRTYAVADMSKEARFQDGVYREDWPAEPVGFEWEAPGLGKLKMTAHETHLDMTVKGYSLKARLTDEILWDTEQSEKGPEGWAKSFPIPTHWYVYSLGSKAEYEFSGPDGALARKGTALAHCEKNWGLTFPNGHVWFQGFSKENDAQILGSAAFFTLGSVKTPYIVSMGYRSPVINIDMRTNDLGTVFKNIEIKPLDGEFSVTGIHAKANPETLCESILAPMAKVKWESACRETFLAEITVEVYEHAAWGIAGDDKLIDKRTFLYAGLEFGEDLLKEATENLKKEDEDKQVERSRAIDS
ncbi:hypothetical protein AXG93_2528s2270 [Marchantia polymorpha subsp. ruderalis]|uniref:AttH domain-containing protein n=1 Tax=Marchantia polymorpha subsp. ruderalis TaxID=1480154 RepID=A0A176WNX0_MARPO|nr:hypothetical protein AXG93_2528s2270 [Marchantia polymorpha subsp. ruderalis]